MDRPTNRGLTRVVQGSSLNEFDPANRRAIEVFQRHLRHCQVIRAKSRRCAARTAETPMVTTSGLAQSLAVAAIAATVFVALVSVLIDMWKEVLSGQCGRRDFGSSHRGRSARDNGTWWRVLRL